MICFLFLFPDFGLHFGPEANYLLLLSDIMKEHSMRASENGVLRIMFRLKRAEIMMG
jgi:hypothetical protein